MHSFLIASKNKKTANDYINEFLNEEKIHPLDRSVNFYEKSVGIEDVRIIQKKILLKPFRGKTKAVVIQVYENITTEAQNALLKILEEPPANTIIVISIQKKELLLPTVISRCKIIILEEGKTDLTDEDTSQLNTALSIILSGTVGDRLKIAQDVSKNKEEGVLWLEKMTIFMRQKLVENYEDSKYLDLLKLLQKTYTIIKSSNVNQRIALENLFLSF